MSERQQFHRGDLVRTLPEYWNTKGFGFAPDALRHPAGWAIILGSYRDQYGGGPEQRHTYSVLWLTEEGQPDYSMSWWDDDQIDFLVLSRCDEMLNLIDEYEDSLYDEDDEEDWDV
jgi:hypothetical protein